MMWNGSVLLGWKKKCSPWRSTVKNVVFLFQTCAKDDSVNAYDRLIKEEEIHSLILTETPAYANSEEENW